MNGTNHTLPKEVEEVFAVIRIWNFFVSVGVVVALFLVGVFMVPRFMGLDTFIVTSGSMEPEYPVGSLILVSDVSPSESQAGDAITFYMTGSQIVATHQVYEIDLQKEVFRTQGINNRDVDGNIIPDAHPVSFDSLIGKPIVCIPFLGYVNRFCTTPPGIYILLGCAAVIVAVSAIVDMTPQHRSPATKSKNKERMKNVRKED